ncbi:hypothetical protein EUX98_g677 [Antrodiella citrinella]|uniref:aminodeoxychorismate synthase n=1 Tax=Antrodiella citrinella TaxID=2447956 RepID=A0A4S4NC34_9APHY|nr:hypothetical protein EUX98_g677 [Antrodiella citrinella]
MVQMSGDPPRILLIDSYDSFTYNLASLCRRSIPNCCTHIIRNDQISVAQLILLLPHFSAVVIGPGPGSPDKDQDVGIVKHIWKLADDAVLPVFGVCLGLQSLAIEFGATLKRLNVVKHGQISKIHHREKGLFEDVGVVEAVRYHSLHVMLEAGGDVECLAWAEDGHENGRVVMAARHTSKPFWAVQYHPESTRTRGGGDEVVRNFWSLAGKWSQARSRIPQPWSSSVEAIVGKSWPHIQPIPRSLVSSGQERLVSTQTVESPTMTMLELCETQGATDETSTFVLLESAAVPGRFSIIGCLSPSSPKITFRVQDSRVCVERNHETVWEELGDRDIWTWLASFMQPRRGHGGVSEVPFWGGFIGFLSYELGTHALSPSLPLQHTEQPDVNLVFVDRSVVFDSLTNRAYVQSLLPGDHDWLSRTASLLRTGAALARAPSPVQKSFTITVSHPNQESYISSIKKAKEYLFSGDSYELCLTAPTRISVQQPSVVDGKSTSWELYKTLRVRNAAAHSGYIRLHPSTLISSSPERFLSFTRPPAPLCQLRPIKGTVRKGPGVTRAVAEEALIGSPKEVAENLMIVDLIRHDLHGVLGEDVVVRQFCAVEENKTVWSMVSVIEGKPSPNLDQCDRHNLGWDVLRNSLPPGSMTGAPKKRSVELLYGLEGQPRSVYSGVFGYWDVGGGGDWSVIIRSCFKHDAGDASNSGQDGTAAGGSAAGSQDWTLGAGGAITALSDPDAEWDEMMAKVESVLRAFQETV